MDNESLPSWFRAVELGPEDSTRLGALGQASSDLAASATVAQVVGMVLLAYGRPDDGTFDAIRGAVLQHDPTYAARADDLETRLLAGACCADVMASGGANAAVAALAILSVEWAGASAPIADLHTLATGCLVTESEAQRVASYPDYDVGAATLNKKLEFTDGAEPVTNAQGAELQGQMTAFARRIQKAGESLQRGLQTELSAALEELDLLWWAFSERSDLARTSWKDFPSSFGTPIAMGVELGSMLRFGVPPRSTEAILGRLLGDRASAEGQLGEFVEAAADHVPPPDGLSDTPLFPVLRSVQECREFSGKSAWRDSVARWSVQPSRKHTMIAVAVQTVREVTLLRNIS